MTKLELQKIANSKKAELIQNLDRRGCLYSYELTVNNISKKFYRKDYRSMRLMRSACNNFLQAQKPKTEMIKLISSKSFEQILCEHRYSRKRR